MGALRILRPGLFTTVQDCGRWGHQAQGVPVSGAMDVYAHRLANQTVGNAHDLATLEVTLMGPQVEFVEAAVFAVCGAEFHLTLNDARVPMNEPVAAGPGSCLRFGERMHDAQSGQAQPRERPARRQHAHQDLDTVFGDEVAGRGVFHCSSFPRKREPSVVLLSSFPRKREPRVVGAQKVAGSPLSRG